MDEEIQKEFDLIKQRNKRVEADKAWETSKFRIFSIVMMTYITTAIVFYIIGVKTYLLSALYSNSWILFINTITSLH